MKIKSTGTTISNCNFNGVNWDAKAIETVQTVALALLNLTELFKRQEIKLECLLKIEDSSKEGEK